MNKRTPRKLREEIDAAKNRIALVRQVLDANSSAKEWGLGVECYKASKALKDLIETFQVPTHYNVAVVGRFKAGKSSFVNELLGRSLAGENTNPETAAVTTFCHGDRVRATIHFIAKADWEELRALFDKEPKDPEAQRIANWEKFASRRADAEDKDSETFDRSKLLDLERKFLADPAQLVTLELNAGLGKKGEAQFRRELKRYTTSTKPYHCLVQRIEISAPSPLLEEGVLLIDTPGLDDTERFRVNLTERAVQDVDAVLFLTQSGAAYGQSEKDFLLTLLRKGTVKQLVFVVTQVDKTYAQHLRQARDEGEEPEPLSRRIQVERERLSQQIDDTLADLGEGFCSSIDGTISRATRRC